MRSNPSLRQVPQNALKRLEDSPQFASKPDAAELRCWLLIVLAGLREEKRQAQPSTCPSRRSVGIFSRCRGALPSAASTPVLASHRREPSSSSVRLLRRMGHRSHLFAVGAKMLISDGPQSMLIVIGLSLRRYLLNLFIGPEMHMGSGGNRFHFEKFRKQQNQNSCSPEIVTGKVNDSLLQQVSTPNDGDIRDDQQ